MGMERYDALSTACDAVILANGQFPRHRVPTQVLEEAKLLVCCDGALATLHRERPELEARLLSEGRLLATGDGDSLSPALRERYGAIFRQVYEQDDNDLTKATRLVLSLVKSAGRQPVVAYLGATGLREDHTIGNVSLLRRYRADFGIRAAMYTDYGCFTPVVGDAMFATARGLQMSIFNCSCSRLGSDGLRWPCRPFREWWEGTLNECIGSEVRFRADGQYIVYLTYEAKS